MYRQFIYFQYVQYTFSDDQFIIGTNIELKKYFFIFTAIGHYQNEESG